MYEEAGTTRRWFGILLLMPALAIATLAGCDKKPADPATTGLQAPLGSDRPLSLESVTRGARLYQENCAQCHGPEAQGHPDWQNHDIVAAPPLDGTGNEWKRKKSEFITIVKDGIRRNGEPAMPGWGDRLSDQEIEDIVAWFQALWPLDVYERWLKVNAGVAPDKKG